MFCCFYSTKTKDEIESYLSSYDIQNSIAVGGYGEIFLQKKSKTVIKKVKRFMFNENEYLSTKEFFNTNIIHIYKRINFNSHIFLFMKYYPNGDLLDYLSKKKKLSLKETKKYLKQMLDCIENLNKIGYVHLDIKLDNFLLDQNMNLVLTDMGSSQPKLPNDFCVGEVSHYTGTKEYNSYELYNDQYSNKSDIWNIGICMYMMLTGKMFSINYDDIFNFNCPKINELNNNGKDFLNNTLKISLYRRLSVNGAKNHIFIIS